MKRWSTRLLVTAACGGLLLTGPCVQIAEGAVIRGFFNATTAILAEWLKAQLGLTNGA